MEQTPEFYMDMALAEAQRAAGEDEVPVGAVIVLDRDPIVIATARNNRESRQNPLGHAELIAIDLAAKKLGRWRLTGCSLYVTLEPCLMCAGAIILSRIDNLYYGATDPKAGAVVSLYSTLSDPRLNHRPKVTGDLREKECSHILKEFFAKKRNS